MTSPSPIAAALTCCCPACGEGRLFQGFLTMKPACDKCGLDYAAFDSGDGPAVFIILGAGFIVVFAALITEVLYQPPFWLHTALWLPLILIVTVLPLRPVKALMVALQHRHNAAESRRDIRDRA